MDPVTPNASNGAPELVAQRSMFPLEVQDIYRNDQGSADLQIIATAANGKDYAVKTTNDGNGLVPASELFCYEIARELSIATPNYDVIKMRDGSLAFGSMWEGGARILKDNAQTLDILTGKIEVRGLKSFLSRVYALDLFVNNIDRHFGNYIFRDSYNSYIALAYDFSRAWYAYDPYGYGGLEKDQNTHLCHKFIASKGGFDPETAKSTLDELFRIELGSINQILSFIPESWLSVEIQEEILLWWGSNDMKDRVLKLRSEIK